MKDLVNVSSVYTTHIPTFRKRHPMLPKDAGSETVCLVCEVDYPCDTRKLAEGLEASAAVLRALVLRGWTVERRSVYDEEAVDAWAWIAPDGREFVELGDHLELPPWPEEAAKALAAQEAKL